MIKSDLETKSNSACHLNDQESSCTSDIQEVEVILPANQSHDSQSVNDKICEKVVASEMRITTEPVCSLQSFSLNCDPSDRDASIDDSLAPPLPPPDANLPQICVNELSNLSLSDKNDEQMEVVSLEPHKWQTYNKLELLAMPDNQVRDILEDLRIKIEGTSSELVFLLQERQRLRDEVAFRNVAIEQLLKVHEKLTWGLTEPLAIQMSVIFPAEKNEFLDCK